MVGLLGLLSGALLLLLPGAALACPQCAGRADGGVAQGVVLTLFVLLPFAVAGAVYRFIRSENRPGAPIRD